MKQFILHCQILKVCGITRKTLNRSFFEQLTWNSTYSYSGPIRILLCPQIFIRHYHFSSILPNFWKFCSKFENYAINQKVFDRFQWNFRGKWVMCSQLNIHKFIILALPNIAPQKNVNENSNFRRIFMKFSK